MKLIVKEFIYDPASPVVIPSCHAATLVRTHGGTLAAWFGGRHEGNDDVQIYTAFRADADGVWTAPVCASTVEAVPHWNPVLFDNGEEILLFYKRGWRIPTWETMVTSSRDGGKTWSAARRLCADDDGGRGPVKNKPLRLQDGSILAPASFEQGRWRCFCDRSCDNGISWDKTAHLAVPEETVEVIQPTLWEDAAGVHMLTRSKNQKIYRSDSADGGRTWCEMYPTAMPNNNSGLDLVQIPGVETHLVLCSNPVTEGRTPLSLSESTDGGETFVRVLDLETEAGEYSYPAVVSDGKYVYGCYTWRREKMVYFVCAL